MRISVKELGKILDAPTPEFPEYVSQLLNLANRDAQGTRPRVVGKVTDLIQEFPGDGIEEWADWYNELKPGVIDIAAERIYDMVEKFRDAIAKIDLEMVQAWVNDLVIVKTYIGLRFQEAILKKVAESWGRGYRLASSEEESKGIDGWIWDNPVSIKPDTYKVKGELVESLAGTLIIYTKTKLGLRLQIFD